MAEFSKDNISNALNLLGIKNKNKGTSTGQKNFGEGDLVNSYSPVDGSLIGSVSSSSKKDYEKAMGSAVEAFDFWRNLPAPQRGEIVRQYGQKLRE